MSEVYRDALGKALTFTLTGAVVTQVDFKRSGTLVASYLGYPDLMNNVAKIPYEITRYSGYFDVIWTYTYDGSTYTTKEQHAVVTPMFTKATLTEWDAEFGSLTDSKVMHLESLVRQIINTYCNQKFEFWKGTEKFYGNGGLGIISDTRITSIDTVNGSPSHPFIIEDDGFGLARNVNNFSNDYNVKIPIE